MLRATRRRVVVCLTERDWNRETRPFCRLIVRGPRMGCQIQEKKREKEPVEWAISPALEEQRSSDQDSS